MNAGAPGSRRFVALIWAEEDSRSARLGLPVPRRPLGFDFYGQHFPQGVVAKAAPFPVRRFLHQPGATAERQQMTRPGFVQPIQSSGHGNTPTPPTVLGAVTPRLAPQYVANLGHRAIVSSLQARVSVEVARVPGSRYLKVCCQLRIARPVVEKPRG